MADRVPVFGGKLSTVGRLIVGMILFLEIVVMSSHILFALLLVLGGIGGDLFFIVVDLVGGGCFLGVVVAQFEVVGLEFMQFGLVEFGDLCVVPGFEEDLVGGGEGALVVGGQAIAPEGVGDGHIVLLVVLLGVVFVVDGLVVLGGAAQLEMGPSLVHLLYLSIDIKVIYNRVGLILNQWSLCACAG